MARIRAGAIRGADPARVAPTWDDVHDVALAATSKPPSLRGRSAGQDVAHQAGAHSVERVVNHVRQEEARLAVLVADRESTGRTGASCSGAATERCGATGPNIAGQTRRAGRSRSKGPSRPSRSHTSMPSGSRCRTRDRSITPIPVDDVDDVALDTWYGNQRSAARRSLLSGAAFASISARRPKGDLVG